jgi:hypothetical protein
MSMAAMSVKATRTSTAGLELRNRPPVVTFAADATPGRLRRAPTVVTAAWTAAFAERIRDVMSEQSAGREPALRKTTRFRNRPAASRERRPARMIRPSVEPRRTDRRKAVLASVSSSNLTGGVPKRTVTLCSARDDAAGERVDPARVHVAFSSREQPCPAGRSMVCARSRGPLPPRANTVSRDRVTAKHRVRQATQPRVTPGN